MGIVATASLITAFLAGTAGLFAPCCVGVLLPSYLASIFRTRTKIFLMTFVYYLGLLTVFLPLGLGIASLGSLFRDYHGVFFTIGGLFMIVLGLSLVSGKSLMLPIHVTPKIGKRHNFWSLYVLGIFSGIATSCCAPVLAGVLALSALPGSWVLGLVYALAFVTGMVVPLFLLAVFIDRTKVLKRFQSLKRQVKYSLFGHQVSVYLSHLVSGTLYILIGIFILLFERRGPEVFAANYQIDINLWVASVTRSVSRFTNHTSEWVWAVVFVSVFTLIAWAAYRQAQKEVVNDQEKEHES
ncbi:MAG TPA: cytochrome c biogenesis CcdA family protein [Candidatus Saccharimonadales bacterium]|nr:cytochrome c biogenesis CcdA family protein [Candidatus Saccharimonadales bacterium]